MPFGVPNEKPKQTSWIEKCVASVKKSNPDYKDNRAIAICKAQLKKNNWKVPESSEEAELSMREELWELEKKIREAVMGPVDGISPTSSPYLSDIFDDYLIIEKGAKLFKVPYSMSGDDISADWDKAIEVERKTVYEPVSEAERQVITKVPNVKRGSHRRITYGNTTIS